MVDLQVVGDGALPTTGTDPNIDLEILCTARDVTMSNAYTAVAFRINYTETNPADPSITTNYTATTVRTVHTDIVDHLTAGLYDENNIGIRASGYVGALDDLVKAAQMPKITMKEKFGDHEDALMAINVPTNSGGHAAAFMVKYDSASTSYILYHADAQVLHDTSNGLCSRVLFTQASKNSVVTQSKDTISLIMNTGHVHPYFYSPAHGIVDGTSGSKDGTEHGSDTDADAFDLNTTTNSLRFQFSVPTTAANIAVDGVTSNVQDATGSGDETHLFFVGSLVTHGEPGLSEDLAADNFIHRTSEHRDPNQDSIRYFTDKKLPVSITFNPASIMEGVWTTTESNFFGRSANAYENFGLDFIANGIHDSTSYDMFTSTNGRGNPLTTVASSIPIVLPKGNYTFQSLGRAINELLHDVDVNTSTYADEADLVHRAFSMDTIRFENNEALKRLFVGAKLSNDYEDDLPSAISLSWDTGTPFAALFSANSISLAAASPEPREYFDALQYTAAGLKTIRTIYVQANFVQGGINPQRRKSQILASIPVDKEPGQTLVANPSLPLKVSAENFLNQGDTNTDLEFTLLDEAGEAVAIGTENPWSVNVLIEWEQDINLARLRQSASETRHR